MTQQPTVTQALTTLKHAINAVLAATPQGEKAETGLLPNAFTEKAQLLATELAKQLEQHPDLDFNNIPPALAVKAIDKLGLEALLSDALAGATEEDQKQAQQPASQPASQPLIKLTEPLDLNQQFAFQFFAGYLRAKLPENQYSALHNAQQKSLVFSNEVAHIEPKLLIGLSLIKTMLPYFSAKNSIQNLNCTVEFSDSKRALARIPIQKMKKPSGIIVCRNLVFEYFRESKPIAYSSEIDIQTRVTPETEALDELLFLHESFYLVHHAKLGKWLCAQAAALNENKTTQTFLLASTNHAMAIHLRLKTREGKNEYVLTFYDPNNTTNHIKLRKPSAEGFHDLTLENLIPKNALDHYFPWSKKIARIYPAPQTNNEREALLAKENQPTVPKALLGYDLEDLEYNPSVLNIPLQQQTLADLGVYRWLFERAKNFGVGSDELLATLIIQDKPKLIEVWLDQEMAVINQEKSEASLGTFHQHMANAQQVFLKLERITTQPICLKFPGMVLKKLNTLDTLANQEGWEPNALAALQNLKTELQQEQNQLDARANPTPPTPWRRMLATLSCGLISVNKPQTH